MLRVLVVDDHPFFRKGIINILKVFSKKFLIDEVDNAFDAVKKATKYDYEIITLDISMPMGGGMSALEKIIKIKPKSKIIMLSIFDDKQIVIQTMKLGARGYLTKTCATDELEKAIKIIRAGGKYICSDVAQKIALMLDENVEKPRHENLTSREFQVFCLYAKGETAAEIAKELSISAKTVTTYRSRLLEKMDMKSTYDIVKYAFVNKLVDNIK